jgi:drug/metabolite transporter (DMT)-like permease
MFRLTIVSLVWAFSFGLISKFLTGVPASEAAAVRLAIAVLVFLPFFRRGQFSGRFAAVCALIGAVQFGLMYVFYLAAFKTLSGYEIALFTIFTPLYVTLFDDALRRRFAVRWLAAAALATLGAGILLWKMPGTLALLAEGSTFDRLRLCFVETLGGEKVQGFLLVQASNACFAAGQLDHKRLRPLVPGATESALFAWAILGGAAAAAAYALATGADFRSLANLGATQWLVLAHLGAVASGLCFFLWNGGATRVSVGVLAVFNNLKIPLGVVCSLVFFETARWNGMDATDIWKLIASFGLMFAAVCLAQPRKNEA